MSSGQPSDENVRAGTPAVAAPKARGISGAQACFGAAFAFYAALLFLEYFPQRHAILAILGFVFTMAGVWTVRAAQRRA